MMLLYTIFNRLQLVSNIHTHCDCQLGGLSTGKLIK